MPADPVSPPDERPRYDAAVVGGGPAGLSAASWLGRYRREVVLVDSEEYRNASVDLSHGFLGNDPIPPDELRRKAVAEVRRYPSVTFEVGRRVQTVTGVRDRFELALEDGSTILRARRVILATGVRDAFPEVDGFFDHYGASVFHCASCDGYEAKDRDVVVFGWGDHIAGFALGLLTWARSVTVITDGRHFEGAPEERALLIEYGVHVLEDEAVELCGPRGDLKAVRLEGGATLPCQLAFFSIAHHPNNRLAADLGCLVVDAGCVEVDRDGVTSVPGVYAAGDLTPGVQLISNAVAKGAAAALHCAHSLLGERP
ncbi:MAG TPA: NAD(P)/FAD-dependent oxidoreductase [Acidimicrobiales bacterium]|nr:NAD(P)/FAD-dependent oxidoreductase [Acidimicrobiales bacterium]